MSKRKKKRSGPKPRQFSNRPLEALAELKCQLPRQDHADTPPPPQEGHRQPQTPVLDDDEVFAQAMSDVAPLEPRPSAPRRAQPQPPRELLAERERREVVAELRRLVDKPGPVAAELSGEHIEGLAPGVQRRLLERLRRGDFSVQDHLDLHGLDRDQARAAVENFLQVSRQRGLRCVLIIHGRGKRSAAGVPVLKNALHGWLGRSALRKQILAFASARPCDGGAGATYVLLRRLA